jgi:hypothetical protein
MKPTEKIEEFVRLGKPHVKTGGEMDKRTIDDSFAAMDETIRAKKQSVAGIILRSRAAKLAAAAAVIAAAGLFLGRDRQKPNGPAAKPALIAQSPAEIISMASMRMAYQRGGFEVLDQQFRDTLNVLGPRPSSISIQELLESTTMF